VTKAGRAALVLVLLVGALLRAYPMHVPYPGYELQEMYPRNAVTALAERNWRPVALHHGGGFMTLLRGLYTAWYGLGALVGRYEDRVAMLAAYVEDPFPFVLVGRGLVLAFALGGLVLVARLGTLLAGERAGVAGAFLLAVTFIHIRESHRVWLDVPAATASLAALLACIRAAATPGNGTMAIAGAAAGLTLATKLSTFPIALSLLLTAWFGAERSIRLAGRRLLVAGVAALAAFALFSPYTFVQLRETVETLFRLHSVLFGAAGASLTLATCIREGIGLGIAALAMIGLVASARTAPRPTAIVAAFSLGYLAVLASESLLYARYLAVLAPYAALFAGAGAAALAPRQSLLVLAALVLIAGAPQASKCLAFDRLLARRDTRQLAADWILAHVPPGTTLSLPNAVPHPNPTLPQDAAQLGREYKNFGDQLRAHGLADPARTYPMRFLAFFIWQNKQWEPVDRFVVTAAHPSVMPEWLTSAEHVAKIQAAGGEVVARFESFTEPLPARAVFEPVEVDYMPLAGFDALIRPGPNLTIWRMPEK
jgi:hypothetical protein